MTTALALTTGVRPDGTPVLTAVGEIDMSNADTFATALTDALTDTVTGAAGGPLVVDLTAVDYLDSAGLSALFEQSDRIKVVSGTLLAPLLEISGLTELTTIDYQ